MGRTETSEPVIQWKKLSPPFLSVWLRRWSLHQNCSAPKCFCAQMSLRTNVSCPNVMDRYTAFVKFAAAYMPYEANLQYDEQTDFMFK